MGCVSVLNLKVAQKTTVTFLRHPQNSYSNISAVSRAHHSPDKGMWSCSDGKVPHLDGGHRDVSTCFYIDVL